jgi:hypothetical protein
MPRSNLTQWVAAARRWVGTRLSNYLSQPLKAPGTAAATDTAKLLACLEPGDVVLVEGRTRVSVAIQYLTQSTWSHAALYGGACSRLAAAIPPGRSVPR